MRQHRAITEKADLDAIALDDGRFTRFVQILAGARYAYAFFNQHGARIQQGLRPEVIHMIVGYRHRIKAAIGEYLRHRDRLAAMRRQAHAQLPVGILPFAIAEAQIGRSQRRTNEFGVCLDSKTIFWTVRRPAIGDAEKRYL